MTATTTALSFDPRTGTAVAAPDPSTPAEVDDAVAAADAVAEEVAAVSPSVRAAWLAAVADALDADADRLVALADEETALGTIRLRGELGRAATALRFYGSVAAEGSYLAATIDRGDGDRADLRRVNRPLGPVAVFGASNFPFGYGVIGHDTGSALAAGCPVVVKAHPAHPRLSAALGELVGGALVAAGAPRATFSLVGGFSAGSQLVLHPSITAVAFTGSQSGGLALWRLANSREHVIPVFAEMGTVNAAVVTTDGAASRGSAIAAGFVESFTLGMGQFCTKPGLLLAPVGSGLREKVAAALAAAAPSGWLLTETIATSYSAGVQRLTAAGARIIAQTTQPEVGWSAAPTVLAVDAARLRPGTPLLEECFGPLALIAEYDGDAELDSVLNALPGSLAAAVHGSGADDPAVAPLVARLARRAGRVIVDGWPTGAPLGWAQNHGGPWPATTVPSASSVGAYALGRFVRGSAYQNVPQAALPPALQDANPWQVPQRVDGVARG